MMSPIFDLTLIWAGIIGYGVIMYVLLDGFVLGQGILFPFAPDEPSRDVMMNSVSPVWDANQTWLVLGGAGLLAAFPLVYAVVLPALYIGVFLMLAALIFRGVAFEFRFKANKSRYLWNWAFTAGAFIAAFAQGAVVGSYIQGFETENFRYVGGALDWLTPFTVLTGLGLVVGYALLGSTWLILKSESYTQDWAYKITPRLLLAVLVIFAIIGVWSPMIDEHIKDRWFSGISLLWVLPLITLLFAGWIYRAIKKRQDGFPFVATVGLFVSTFVALLLSKWPYVVPPNYTFWDAASSQSSQLFLLIGLLFVIPFVLMYSAWSYWVFRGKVKAGEGYH